MKGKLVDSFEMAVANITIQYSNSKDTFITFSNTDGNYYFSKIQLGTFTLHASRAGLVLFTDSYSLTGTNDDTFNVPTIRIRNMGAVLQEMVVTASPIIVKEDTIQYNASAFKVREGSLIEDVIKKFPGVSVDKDGNITAQGKAVVKLRINGKDFFAGDVQTATQNLPADIISNVQIIDDYGEQATLTGIKTGEPQKIINLNIREDKNRGNFGRVTLGAGDDSRYIAGTSLNSFDGDRQVSLLASINNTSLNANSFNVSGGRGSPGGTNNGQFGNNSGNGVTATKSFGLSYRNNWSKKLLAYGSYSFSNRNNYVESSLYQQDFNPSNILVTSSIGSNSAESDNHRLTWNLEYSMDTGNYFKFASYASTSSISGLSNSMATISRPRFFTNAVSRLNSESTGPTSGASLTYNHKFKKRGRIFNLSVAIDYSNIGRTKVVDNNYINADSTGIDSSIALPVIMSKTQNQRQGDDNINFRSRVDLSYIEPLFKHTVVEFNYGHNISKGSDDHDVYDIDSVTRSEVPNTALTNHYRTTFTSDRFSLNIQSAAKKFNSLIGLNVQPSRLQGFVEIKSQQTDYSTLNWAPNARFVYHFSSSRTLTLYYLGNSREPDFQKLQPVVDSTNLSNIIIGNPDLKTEFNNIFSAAYNSSGRKTGQVLFGNFSFVKTLNKIVNSIVNDIHSTSHTTTILNTNGFYSLNGNASLSTPFAARKYMATVNVAGSFNNNISYADYQRNDGQNWTLRPTAKLQIDLLDRLEFEINGGYAINRTLTFYENRRISTETQTALFGLSGKVYFLKDLTLGYDYSKALNKGYGDNTITNPDVLNLFIEYRFLSQKKATIRFQGFDLLNENSRLTRTVNATAVTDVRANGLLRYFLLTCSLRLSRFRN